MESKALYNKAIELLKKLISTPSLSKEEDNTAALIADWFKNENIEWKRDQNNIWATNKHFDASKPTILLNSHHDTVKPNKGYTKDPFNPVIEDGKLYGLGSNDAGASLVSLMATFSHFYSQQNLKYNLVIAATAEEENSGPNGLAHLKTQLPSIDFAIVGEPTGMNMAIAEKGLLVIDGVAKGTAGHAAHPNDDNAIYNALKDIQWIEQYQFPKVSDLLGPVKMTVTQINAGQQHNVVPDNCHFVVDVRVNECYSNEEVFDTINKNTKSEMAARSFRLNSSSIPLDHPFVQGGIKLGRTTYGSPTLSDQAILTCPSVKVGPGDSTRSHQADEYIYLNEVEEGIGLYIKMLNEIIK
ncbi:M20 family metallo-hydrolase [Fulvivirga sp.]|uniref:M20 family metallo-hydrolase n=1 Tax=Fulvivirga sp. TaxID=1931237 RepID=UPI0032EF2C59